MRLAVWLIERPRWFKRTLLIINDLAMLTIALWLAYSLRWSQLYVPFAFAHWMLFAAAPVIGVVTFHLRGLYKLVTRYIGPEGTTRSHYDMFVRSLEAVGRHEVVSRWENARRALRDICERAPDCELHQQ